jgi:hypothetical protein
LHGFGREVEAREWVSDPAADGPILVVEPDPSDIETTIQVIQGRKHPGLG